MVQSQLNLRDAIEGRLEFTAPQGKHYALGGEPATIVVRPRGWHLPEKHLLVDDERMSGSLFDFGLYFFHCARLQVERGTGPYFYLRAPRGADDSSGGERPSPPDLSQQAR